MRMAWYVSRIVCYAQSSDLAMSPSTQNMDHDEPMLNPCSAPASTLQSSPTSRNESHSTSTRPSSHLPSTSHSPTLSSLGSYDTMSSMPSSSPLPRFFSSTAIQDTPSFHSPSPSLSSSPRVRQAQQVPLPSSPTRKQRFTMGPRLDCEKCRLGVPGHYSHLN